MRHEVEQQTGTDPGVMFFEPVNLDDVSALEARETQIGNDSFAVTLLPSAATDRIVLTRLAYDVDVFGVPLLGLDATGMSGTLIPVGFGAADFEIYIIESAEIFRFVPVDAPDQDMFGRFSAVMLAPVRSSGQPTGWAVSIMTVDNLIGLSNISTDTELDFSLRVDDFEEIVGASTEWTDSTGSDAQLSTVSRIETAGLGWDVEIVGGSGFAGGPPALLDQRSIWIGGVVLTALALLAAARRQATRRRLDSARFELEHARTLASTDALTGLLNRNGLIDSARQASSSHPANLFFIDLDGFKLVNDTDGHERGDQVLRSVANELRSIFRSDDLVGRLGGDEFVVFARRSASKQFVPTASKRITEAVSGIDSRVTCSVGVSSRAANSSVDVKDMLRLADAAMYEAKRSGGDRYEVAA